MKRLKFLPSVLMLVLCVGVLCMGIYAASPNSNQITGSITINPANAAVDILYWAEKADGTQSTKIPLTNVRNGGETINFNNTATFGDFLKLDFSTATNAGDVEPCYIKIQITNKSSAKELGAYFSTHEVTEETVFGDIFTSAPLANSDKVGATSVNIYGWMDEMAQEGTANTTTLTLEFRANDFIETGDPISFNNYYVNIEEYVATYNELTEGYAGGGNGPPSSGMSGAPAIVKLSSGITEIPTRCFDSSYSNNNPLLKMVIGPNVTTVGDSSFYNAAGLLSVVFPNVETINQCAFLSCAGLEIAYIPSTITIGQGAFQGCTVMSSLKLDTTGNITISRNAFTNCSGITNVQISSSGNVSIGEGSFTNCTGMTSIQITGSQNNFGSAPFSGCSNLERIVVLGEAITGVDGASGILSGLSKLSYVKLLNECLLEKRF